MNVKEKLKTLLDQQQSERNELSIKDLPAPSLIPGLTEAAEKIIANLSEGQRMLIVGDYDCDGIMATTLMIDFFRELGYGAIVDYIVPDRFVDGYGVSNNMVDFAIENAYDFIVTVDNGIGAYDAIEYANKNNIEVILTDHHTVGEKVPNASIIVNLKYKQGDFPFQEISGATIAWYVCAQININLKAGIDMKKWLDLVGITVISDVMPLMSLNVALVKFAIKSIKQRKRYLLDLVFPANKRDVLTETDIGFAFVPMINAVGRLEHAKYAIEILLSRSKGDVKRGHRYLIEINNRRKAITQDLLNVVTPEAEKQLESGARALVVRADDLHEGIVGILAGKLAEKYMRPVFVFGWNKAKNCWKGSGRTTGKIDLYTLSKAGKQFALGWGGHVGAVGVAISKDSFSDWKDQIVSASGDFHESDFLPLGEKPMELSFADVDFELMDLLDQYRPFGHFFPMPRFKTTTFISIIQSYKEGLHTKCFLIDNNGSTMEGFFFHDKALSIFNNKTVEILYEPVREIGQEGLKIGLHAEINYLDE